MRGSGNCLLWGPLNNQQDWLQSTFCRAAIFVASLPCFMAAFSGSAYSGALPQLLPATFASIDAVMRLILTKPLKQSCSFIQRFQRSSSWIHLRYITRSWSDLFSIFWKITRSWISRSQMAQSCGCTLFGLFFPVLFVFHFFYEILRPKLPKLQKTYWHWMVLAVYGCYHESAEILGFKPNLQATCSYIFIDFHTMSQIFDLKNHETTPGNFPKS